MHETIEIRNSEGRVSRILIGEVIGLLGGMLPEGRVIAVTDGNLLRRHPALIGAFDHIIIERGEEHKTLSTVEYIHSELLRMGADRKTFILGIGGGIVTDVTGFVASTYMRGVRFGFVATSLLAQVDASVGGKNGVNLGGYKNIVGTFNQPEFVLCDTGLLSTLPEAEFRTGLSEIIKAGIIADPELFGLFEKHAVEELREGGELLREAIYRTVKVKADIVGRDEREGGERKKLNLGHTLGHAIEKCSREFSHGEAVAIGTAFIARLSESMGLIDIATRERILNVIEGVGLPIDCDIDRSKLIDALKLDKKKEEDTISVVLINGIGSCEVRKMPLQEFEKLASV